MSRYTILLNKPYVKKNDGDDRFYFMGITSNENEFTMVVGHLEIYENDFFFFKRDAEFSHCKESIHISPIFNLYTMKNNLMTKIKERSDQEFLFEYLSQMNKLCEVVPINTKWRDDLGDAIRFWKINYDSIVPEYAFDALLLALSACVDDIEKYGKEFLRA